MELWVPWSENVKTDHSRGKEKGVALHNHQHGSTTNLKQTEVNKKYFWREKCYWDIKVCCIM